MTRQPILARRCRSLGRRIGVEAKLLGADANHISATERLGIAGARSVHEDAIRADVTDDVASGPSDNSA